MNSLSLSSLARMTTPTEIYKALSEKYIEIKN